MEKFEAQTVKDNKIGNMFEQALLKSKLVQEKKKTIKRIF